MFKATSDFINAWQVEVELTEKVFAALTDACLTQIPGKDVRSPGRLAWHITQTLTEMPHKAGILAHDALDEKPIPATGAEILDTYKRYNAELVAALTEKWGNSDLNETVSVYGQEWPKAQVLTVLINHQIHHRAQLMTVMRLVGVKVPGIYGPAKEEWAQFGMEAQE